MRLLDLFSGIGGFSLGLEAAGFQTVAFCEVAPASRHLLAHHWPEVPCYDDIRTLTGERLAADGIGVDAICGGFPCQDISFAGEGAGLSGARSGLWREYARLIRELRPRVVIVENVAALLGRGLGVVLGDLAALGFDAEWDCIRALDVGAPHLRDRLWIVAYARSQQHEGFGDAFRRSLTARLLEAAVANSGDCGHGADDGSAEDRSAPPEDQGQGIVTGQSDPEGRPRPQPGQAGSRRDGFGGWATEPDVGRVAHGVPRRLDRLHGLGNAVVPQIPEILGRAILAAEAERLAA